MGKSCLDGYLTEECKKCPDWTNNKDSIGCACCFPIMECKAFAKMYNEREQNRCDIDGSNCTNDMNCDSCPTASYYSDPQGSFDR